MKLTIDLVPKSSWFKNLRSLLKDEEWDILRKATYKAANYTCEICGGKGEQWPVECHEVWKYVRKKKKNNKYEYIQRLERLIALCPTCHKCKHFGLTELRGERELAFEHLMRVNQINEDATEQMIQDAFVIFRKRSSKKWKLDLKRIEAILPEKNQLSLSINSQSGENK